jgi:hypothetical protein
VEQVRQARLSDYFRVPDLVSILRERMVYLSGDDSVMDTRIVAEGDLPNEGDSVFVDPRLAEALGDVLDTFAEAHQLDLSGQFVVEADHVVKPLA